MSRIKINVSIIGITGFIGGSLGMALVRKGNSRYRVTGIGRNPRRLARASRLRACHRTTRNMEKGIKTADLVVIATPVESVVPSFKRISRYLKSSVAVTDVSSVKGIILKSISSHFSNDLKRSFVGGHPIAGSEKTGVDSARANLFQGATCVLTTDNNPYPKARATVARMWRDAGARLISMSAAKHDQNVSVTSHLPHVLAGALVHWLWQTARRSPEVTQLLGGSFWDMTRVASCDPKQWDQILRANQLNLRSAIGSFSRNLTTLLKGSSWQKFFTKSRAVRHRLDFQRKRCQ